MECPLNISSTMCLLTSKPCEHIPKQCDNLINVYIRLNKMLGVIHTNE